MNRVADTSVKKGLALWYVGSRISEGCFYLVAVLATWAFLPLSREFAAAGAPDASHFQTSGTVLQSTSDLALTLAQSVFAIGAVMLYYLLFQSRLVPRWLALWGLVAAPLFLIASLSLLWTGDPNSTLANILFVPLALQEMVLAVWLIGVSAPVAAALLGPVAAAAVVLVSPPGVVARATVDCNQVAQMMGTVAPGPSYQVALGRVAMPSRFLPQVVREPGPLRYWRKAGIYVRPGTSAPDATAALAA